MYTQTSYGQSTRKPGRFTKNLPLAPRFQPSVPPGQSAARSQPPLARRGLLALLLAVLIPPALLSVSRPARASESVLLLSPASPATSDAVESNSILDDTLGGIIDVFSLIESIVAGQSGPLPPEDRAVVADQLTFVISTIALVFDTNQPGSISPEAGAIDASINPDTLADYAKTVTNLAKAAAAEVRIGDNFNQDYVATKLKTIEHLITRDEPHSYRSRAGIE